MVSYVRNKSALLINFLLLVVLSCSEEADPLSLTVNPLNVEFQGFASQKEITINSNSSWNLSSNEPWIVVNPETGSGTQTITLTVLDNPGTSIRSASLTVQSSADLPTKTVSIAQFPRVEIVAGGNGPGSNLNQLHEPAGICLDNMGNLFIADQLNQRVVRWSSGSMQGVIVAGGNGTGDALNQFNVPYGIYVKSNGSIYVSDIGNSRIMKWSPPSSAGVVVAGGNGGGVNLNQLNAPNGLYVDSNDTIYVSEGANSRISKWASGGVIGKLVAHNALTDLTQSMFRDSDGNIFVVSGNLISKFDGGSGNGSIVAGNLGQGTGLNQLNEPTGVYVTSNGDIYISDNGNDRIVKWPAGSDIGIIVAGGNGKGSRLDQLDYPIGIWLDQYENIYIADRGNHRVVKWFK